MQTLSKLENQIYKQGMQLLIAAISILLLIFTQATKAEEIPLPKEEYQFTLGSSGFGYGSYTGFILYANAGIAKRLSDHWQLAGEGRTQMGAGSKFNQLSLGLNYNFETDFKNTWYVGAGAGGGGDAEGKNFGFGYARVGYRNQLGDSQWSYTPTLNFTSWGRSGFIDLDFLSFTYSF